MLFFEKKNQECSFFFNHDSQHLPCLMRLSREEKRKINNVGKKTVSFTFDSADFISDYAASNFCAFFVFIYRIESGFRCCHVNEIRYP